MSKNKKTWEMEEWGQDSKDKRGLLNYFKGHRKVFLGSNYILKTVASSKPARTNFASSNNMIFPLSEIIKTVPST